jgi:hypothetical protein
VREISTPVDIAIAFDWIAGPRVDGVFLIADPMFDANIDVILRLTRAHPMPAISGAACR